MAQKKDHIARKKDAEWGHEEWHKKYHLHQENQINLKIYNYDIGTTELLKAVSNKYVK